MRIAANGRVDITGSLYVNGTPKMAVDNTIFTSAMATDMSALETDSDGNSYVDIKLAMKNLLNRIAALES